MAWLPVLRKELRLYFGSPVAWVLIAMFLVLSGFYFSQIFFIYTMQSIQASMNPMMGGGSLNPVDSIMRPLLHFMAVMLLFFVPMLTMRLFAEEKRSGTIELLLTAPLTDFQIIAGKFLGAMGLYAAMLAVTIPHIAALFWLGNPEWIPIVVTYLGLLLMGGCFISVGLFISSLTKNQIVAVMATFTVFLMLWVINWIASFMGPRAQDVLNYLSITDHLDDFTRGVIDTKHLVYYISFISFGLYLTMRSVDTERWRG